MPVSGCKIGLGPQAPCVQLLWKPGAWPHTAACSWAFFPAVPRSTLYFARVLFFQGVSFLLFGVFCFCFVFSCCGLESSLLKHPGGVCRHLPTPGEYGRSQVDSTSVQEDSQRIVLLRPGEGRVRLFSRLPVGSSKNPTDGISGAQGKKYN